MPVEQKNFTATEIRAGLLVLVSFVIMVGPHAGALQPTPQPRPSHLPDVHQHRESQPADDDQPRHHHRHLPAVGVGGEGGAEEAEARVAEGAHRMEDAEIEAVGERQPRIVPHSEEQRRAE